MKLKIISGHVNRTPTNRTKKPNNTPNGKQNKLFSSTSQSRFVNKTFFVLLVVACCTTFRLHMRAVVQSSLYNNLGAFDPPHLGTTRGSSPIPRSNSISDNHEDLDRYGYMAACLFVNDENHRLIEWIAYHYYVAGVRRIIITNTPYSTTTPRPILDRWTDRINITIWNELRESDYSTDNRWWFMAHRRNQNNFMGLCHRALKKEGWKWAFSIDMDEYLMVNHLLRVPGHPLYNLNLFSNDIIIPSQREASSIPKLLSRVEPYRNTSNPYLYPRPCLQYARKQFSNVGAYSLSPAMEPNVDLLKGIDTPRMNTFRWPFLSTNRVFAKGIAELSRLPISDVSKYHNPHYPVGRHIDHCTHLYGYRPEISPVVIHHYPATWSEMLSRTNLPLAAREYGEPGNVTSHLEDRYRLESNTTNVKEQHIQEWLLGFINFMGKEEAGRLLQGVGRQKETKFGAEIVWAGASTSQKDP